MNQEELDEEEMALRTNDALFQMLFAEDEEGLTIFKAYIGIVKWLSLGSALTDRNGHNEAERLIVNFITKKYNLKRKGLLVLKKDIFILAETIYEENPLHFQIFLEKLEIVGTKNILSIEAKENLIKLLDEFLEIIAKYETEDLIVKYTKVISEMK